MIAFLSLAQNEVTMSDPIHKVDKSQLPPDQIQTPSTPKEEFTQEDLSNISPLEKELITKYSFTKKEAETFNKNFIQLSMQAMKKDLDSQTASIKKMFKEDQD